MCETSGLNHLPAELCCEPCREANLIARRDCHTRLEPGVTLTAAIRHLFRRIGTTPIGRGRGVGLAADICSSHDCSGLECGATACRHITDIRIVTAAVQPAEEG